MNSSLGSLILILMFGGTSGNSVKQTSQVIVSEGASVTMNCTYTSTGYPTLFWYVHYPNKALQFLQRETMENSKNFGARNVKDKSSPIVKYSVRVSDSAVYYYLLSDTVSRAWGQLYKNLKGPDTCLSCNNNDEDLASFVGYSVASIKLTGVSGQSAVEQSPQYLSAQEGEFLTINCNYSIGINTLHWFRQNPGGGLVSLFMLSAEMKEKGRLSATINTRERHSSLHITACQPGDSAIYFCAIETQCSPRHLEPVPKL